MMICIQHMPDLTDTFIQIMINSSGKSWVYKLKLYIYKRLGIGSPSDLDKNLQPY